ncbi:PDZ domain-containing protein, partial [Bacillus paranthracis]|nr:PDZ domain-containing protein [Bacillus paranthracis]
TRTAYVAERNDGLVELGTIPKTIGAELNLLPGEMISKVNGVIARRAEEFYDANQTKTRGVFCKLEGLDTNGDLRLAQMALY